MLTLNPNRAPKFPTYRIAVERFSIALATLIIAGCHAKSLGGHLAAASAIQPAATPATKATATAAAKQKRKALPAF